VKTTIEWISVGDRLPYDGAGVVAAVTGRYPVDPDDHAPDSLSGREFWIVLPMYFRRHHPVDETGEVIEDCFIDSDGVLRLPIGGSTDETVTHWAEHPPLPGTDAHRILGDDVRSAIRAVSGS
jgi:hypothetical protein